jgi:thioredoxin-dependent peroxiredoxin
MLETGSTAPDFTLRDQDDNPVTLSDLRGNPVVLYFYPKADTPGSIVSRRIRFALTGCLHVD